MTELYNPLKNAIRQQQVLANSRPQSKDPPLDSKGQRMTKVLCGTHNGPQSWAWLSAADRIVVPVFGDADQMPPKIDIPEGAGGSSRIGLPKIQGMR